MTSFRLFCSLLALVLLTGASAAGVTAASKPWTVRRAIDFALENSPDVEAARQRIAAARAAVRAASAADAPWVGVDAGYSRTNTPMHSFGNILNQGSFTREIDFNDPGTSDDINLTLSARYRFYDGGVAAAGVKAAQAAAQAALTGKQEVFLTLSFEVVRSFYAIMRARENVQARESALKAIDLSLQTAQARYEAGDLLKADLLSLEVQKSRAADDLITARHGLELARRAFLNLLGLEQGPVEINPACRLQQVIPENPSYDKRPEILRLQKLLDAARARLQAARRGDGPTADLFASYRFDQGLEFDQGFGHSWMAGVKVNYTLYNGHRTRAEIARAEARVAEIRAQLRKMKLGFNYEIQQAQLALRQAEERIQVTAKMVEQAEENGRLSREQFKEGVILSSDLIEVENRLTDARLHHLSARIARCVAIADLRRAAGLAQFE